MSITTFAVCRFNHHALEFIADSREEIEKLVRLVRESGEID
jgi:hypothetical protein